MTTKQLLPYIAHLDSSGALHLLEDHLEGVASLASSFSARFGAEPWGKVAGLRHDLGKYAHNFQQMIRVENGLEANWEDVPDAPRDHSSAGAIHVVEETKLAGFSNPGIPLAFVIAGHHGGLPDRASLVSRIRERGNLLTNALAAAPPKEILRSIPLTPPSCMDVRTGRTDTLRLEMWIRILFSALVDADFLDTEAFLAPDKAKQRRPGPTIASLAERLARFLDGLQAKAIPTEVNRVRAEVLDACRIAAAQKPGVFSLTVPTGGGKTFSSLAFALAHATQHELDRVIVAIPFSSIIEQTAEAFRLALGEDAVLEHHTSIDSRRETMKNRLASENWDAPIVVTTTVQLFDSLFANRPGACRKLHRIARSVIILDEAQTLPTGLLYSIVDGLKTLVNDFGTSVVICTATQPALGKSAFVPFGFESVQELIPSHVRAFDRLQRVRVRWPKTPESVPFDELAREIATEPDALAIVHLRKDAYALCVELDSLLKDTSTMHLSALMCADHRSALIREIKQRKQRGEAVRVVSTQLVEAGVDLDFRIVYRALGGLDAMAQAAGRCNREGLLNVPGELRVFIAATQPPLGVPRTALGVTQALLARWPELDLFASSSYVDFFSGLYGARDLDAKGVQPSRAKLDFKTTADLFKLIEDDWSAPLVVPYGGASQAVARLEHEGASRDTLRGLQRFTVNVPRFQLDQWLAYGFARMVEDTVAVLDGPYSTAYDLRFGLLPGRVGTANPSSLIIDD